MYSHLYAGILVRAPWFWDITQNTLFEPVGSFRHNAVGCAVSWAPFFYLFEAARDTPRWWMKSPTSGLKNCSVIKALKLQIVGSFVAGSWEGKGALLNAQPANKHIQDIQGKKNLKQLTIRLFEKHHRSGHKPSPLDSVFFWWLGRRPWTSTGTTCRRQWKKSWRGHL